jgi:hypothetical protein
MSIGVRIWHFGRLRQLAALLVILCGCSGLSRLPADGGPSWTELESDHFVLQTDLDPGRARELLEQTERLFEGLLQAGWPSGGVIHLRLNLVVLAEWADFEHFAGDRAAGYFVREALLEPLVVMPAPRRSSGFETLAHELAHYIAAQSLQNQPLWLAEGLATYYQTARFDSNGDFVIGGVPRDLHRMLQAFGRMPSSQLMSPATSAHSAWSYYPTAWLLMHYLRSRQEEGLARYMVALGRGTEHGEAWRAAFGTLDHARLDSALADYASRGSYDNFVLKAQAARPTAEPRRMTNADVAALRGLLYATCYGCGSERKQRAREFVEHALREQPQHLHASAVHLLHLAEQRDRVAHEARALAQAYPDAWLPAVMLALSEWLGGVEPDAAMKSILRALELAPHQPYALMVAALRHAQLGERTIALARAEHASRLQPTNPRLMAMRLLVLDTLGECEQLETAARGLLTMLHVSSETGERSAIGQRAVACRQRRVEAASTAAQ